LSISLYRTLGTKNPRIFESFISSQSDRIAKKKTLNYISMIYIFVMGFEKQILFAVDFGLITLEWKKTPFCLRKSISSLRFKRQKRDDTGDSSDWNDEK